MNAKHEIEALAVLVRLALFLALPGFPALSQAFGDPVLPFGDTGIRVAGARLALAAGAVVILVGGLLSRGGLAHSRAAPFDSQSGTEPWGRGPAREAGGGT